MSNSLKTFLADATKKAAEDLVTAYLRIPEDKRAWSPEGKGRSALDQVVECTLLNRYNAELIRTRQMNPAAMEIYAHERTEAAALDWETLKALLEENTSKAVEAIHSVPEEDLDVSIELPWRPMKMSEILAYFYWNMTYHQGQINYIASLLGCLE